MSVFKPGQKVRIVSCIPGCSGDGAVGKEGIIVRRNPPEYVWEWVVDVPAAPYEDGHTEYGFNGVHLAPLTDPDSEWADAKIKELLKVSREPQTLHPSELERVGGGR